MIIAGTVGRECKCCLIKFALRSKIVCDSGAYQENKSRDRAGKLTFDDDMYYVNFYDENNKLAYCSAYRDTEMILEPIQ